jgi:hypothetical protein
VLLYSEGGADVLLIIHDSVQIIGRVHADPDYLPRSSDFGLNQHVFREKFCCHCPEPFYRVAFLCCDLNPDKRQVTGFYGYFDTDDCGNLAYVCVYSVLTHVLRVVSGYLYQVHNQKFSTMFESVACSHKHSF